jgi:hypothetical protein
VFSQLREFGLQIFHRDPKPIRAHRPARFQMAYGILSFDRDRSIRPSVAFATFANGRNGHA